jgi:hypothetical protein
MRYVGIRNPRAEHNPLRSIPLFRPASILSRPSETDILVGALRRALYAVDALRRADAAARADLGRANRAAREYRRLNQAHAMRKLNAVRKQMRANYRLIADSEAELIAMGVSPSEWAIAGRA